MNKRELAMLEEAFYCEVESGVTGKNVMFQKKNNIVRKLVEGGYLEPVTHQFKDRFGVITCHGYGLTHAGRYAYCATCTEPTD